MNIRTEILKLLHSLNPLALLLMLIYVAGVVLLIYSLMQLVHGFEAKDEAFRKRGRKFLGIALLLLLARVLGICLKIL